MTETERSSITRTCLLSFSILHPNFFMPPPSSSVFLFLFDSQLALQDFVYVRSCHILLNSILSRNSSCRLRCIPRHRVPLVLRLPGRQRQA